MCRKNNFNLCTVFYAEHFSTILQAFICDRQGRTSMPWSLADGYRTRDAPMISPLTAEDSFLHPEREREPKRVCSQRPWPQLLTCTFPCSQASKQVALPQPSLLLHLTPTPSIKKMEKEISRIDWHHLAIFLSILLRLICKIFWIRNHKALPESLEESLLPWALCQLGKKGLREDNLPKGFLQILLWH